MVKFGDFFYLYILFLFFRKERRKLKILIVGCGMKKRSSFNKRVVAYKSKTTEDRNKLFAPVDRGEFIILF